MTEREAILEAMKPPPVGGYYVWDCAGEDDRPATPEELQARLEAARRKHERPGWQTRVNDAMRECVKSHGV